jgi:Na+/proline symporter
LRKEPRNVKMKSLALLLLASPLAMAASKGSISDLPFGPGGIAVFIVYLCGVLGVGVYALWQSRKEKDESTMEDNFLAGKQGLGLLVLFFTLFASTFSGWTLLGMPGDAFRDGVRAIVWVSSFAVLYLVAIIVVPRVYRLARPRRWMTVSQFLWDRFESHPLQILGTAVCILPTFLYALLQFKAMGACVQGLTGGAMDPIFGAIALGAVMVVYETIGGMRGVCFVQVFQGLLLMACFGAFWVLQYTSFDGFGDALRETSKIIPAKTWVITHSQQASFMSLIIIMLSFPLYPHQMVRYFSAGSSQKLKQSVALLAFTAFFSFFSVMLVGWVSIPRHCDGAMYPECPVTNSDEWVKDGDSDQIVSYMVNDLIDLPGEFGYWLSVFLMCGAVAAMMSTADASLMATSSMVTADYAKKYFWRQKWFKWWQNGTEKGLLIFSKVLVFIIIVGLIIISAVDIQLTGLAKLQQQFLMQIAPAIVLGLYMEKLDGASVVGGMATGCLVTTFIMIAEGTTTAFWSNMHAGFWGFVFNMIVTLGMYFWEQYRPRAEDEPAIKTCAMIKELNDSDTDEPIRHRWVWIVAFILFLLLTPWYRPTGGQDGFVGPVPAWAFVTLLVSFILACLTCFATLTYWQDEPVYEVPNPVAAMKDPEPAAEGGDAEAGIELPATGDKPEAKEGDEEA